MLFLLLLLFRYEFELVINSLESSALGCISVRLTFANMRCINEHATMSLLLQHPVPRHGNDPDRMKTKGFSSLPQSTGRRVLCGPVRLKPLIDVTEQSLQVLFSHPQMLSLQAQVLLVSVNDFFSSEYNMVSYYEDNVPVGGDAASRRQAWRNRAFRHHVYVSQSDTNKAAFPVKVCCR